MKPIIGIVSGILREGPFATERVYANRDYIDAVERAGGTPILLPVVKKLEQLDSFTKLCDGFLFTGGVDIAPLCYGEEPLPFLGETNADMDAFQIPLFQKVMKTKKAVLAICRGIQVMNVSCGGTLYQDVRYASEHVQKHTQQTDVGNSSQTICIEPGSKLADLWGKEVLVNSYHHQSVKKPGEGLVVVAKAKDGIVEAVEVKEHPFAVGVQWHPEVMLRQSESMLPLFNLFIDAAKNKV